MSMHHPPLPLPNGLPEGDAGEGEPERVEEKQEPVFRSDARQYKSLARDDDAKISHPALDGDPGVEPPRPDTSPGTAEAAALAPAERDQLARDIAEIESAAVALRRAEPALQAWPDPPARPPGKARSIWLRVGVLWLSTALVTAAAAVAIVAFVG